MKTLVSFYVCSWLMDLWRSQPPHYRGDGVELVILNWMRQETNWCGLEPHFVVVQYDNCVEYLQRNEDAEFSTSPNVSDLSLTCDFIKTEMSDVKVVSRLVSLVCIQRECWVHVWEGEVKKSPFAKLQLTPKFWWEFHCLTDVKWDQRLLQSVH